MHPENEPRPRARALLLPAFFPALLVLVLAVQRPGMPGDATGGESATIKTNLDRIGPLQTEDGPPARPVGQLDDGPIYRVPGEPKAFARADLVLTGREEGGRYFLYRALDPELNTGPMGEPYYWVPDALGACVRVTPAKPEPASP